MTEANITSYAKCFKRIASCVVCTIIRAQVLGLQFKVTEVEHQKVSCRVRDSHDNSHINSKLYYDSQRLKDYMKNGL